jgi:hypothetical protein
MKPEYKQHYLDFARYHQNKGDLWYKLSQDLSSEPDIFCRATIKDRIIAQEQAAASYAEANRCLSFLIGTSINA